MPFETTRGDTQKVTITLPKTVLQRLNELIPARQRSRFISETLEMRIALEEQLLALDESAGVWSEENHPDMQDGAAIDCWLEILRSSWSRTGDDPDGRLSS
jgi:hypothetical protein